MPRYSVNLEAIKKAIEISGGMLTLSKKATFSYQSILDWKSGRKIPSPLNCQKIEKATEGLVKAEDILIDYPWENIK